MRKLAILTFQTLDGVMQAPGNPEEDHSGGFTHGGWATGCWNEVMNQVEREAMAVPYDLLLGRATYQLFASSFSASNHESSVAKMLNEAKKYVITSTLKQLDWQNSEVVDGDIAAEIARLKEEDGPLLQVHGSWQLIQALLSYELIDEFRLWTFPVLVGSGKRLFAEGTLPANLTLSKYEALPSGAFMSFYQPRSKAVE